MYCLERSEDDGFVLDVVDDQPLAGLDQSCADVLNVGDGDHEAVLAGASAFHFAEEFLLDRVHQLGAKVPRVQLDLVVQRDVVKHFWSFTCCTKTQHIFKSSAYITSKFRINE